jgi:translation initiation factor 2B subunit (eIF-2B alpha/beta/delta family)
MWKILSIKRYREILEHRELLTKKLRESRESLKNAHDTNETLQAEIKSLKNTISVMDERNKVLSENTFVKMLLDDTLTKATPVVKYNPAIVEKLIELGYINDAMSEDKFAIQIALLTISNEAISQIIESFEQEFDDV